MPDIYWYNIGEYDWSSNKSSNQSFITDMVTKGKSLKISAGIYTSRVNWKKIVGLDWSYPAEQGLPLWYSDLDSQQNFSDFQSFGGWTSPTIKQYMNAQKSCSVSIDYDYLDSLRDYEFYASSNEFEPFL